MKSWEEYVDMNKDKKKREKSTKDRIYEFFSFGLAIIAIIVMILVASIIGGCFETIDRWINEWFWGMLKGAFDWVSELFR